MTNSRLPAFRFAIAKRTAHLRVSSSLLTFFALLCSLSVTPRSVAQPYGMTQRAPIGAFLNGRLPTAAPSAATGWNIVDAFPSLTFKDPTFLTYAPGTNRLYVTSLWGVIYQFTNDPAATTSSVFLDISDHVQVSDSCGLLGMVFHPEFGKAGSPNRGYFYVWYQYSPTPAYGYRPAYNRLSRFTVPDGATSADRASELVLIDQYDADVWHNGGGMFFGDDGFLYLTNGDGGGANDAYNNSQRIDFGLFSGVMRIDVNMDPAKSHPIRRHPLSSSGTSPSFSGNYYIPNDNPFQDPSGGVLEEFWAIGLRSPHRMTYDRVAKQIWVGDVGETTGEEVDIIEKGGNYQWSYIEGVAKGAKPKPATLFGVEQPPIYSYPHQDGNSCVIGGYVYRGKEHAAILDGMYIFGDNGSGRIWALNYGGGTQPAPIYLGNLPGTGLSGLSSFGVDQNGEVLLCKMGAAGKIYKLARGSDGPAAPALLSQTGVFTDLVNLTPAPGLIPYTVNSPLWSDGAAKRRWIAVPNDGAPYGANETIAFTPQGEWMFPAGTVFVKQFEMTVDETQLTPPKRLETRLLVRDVNGGVYGLTYKWRDDGSDADLLPGSLNEEIVIRTADGPRTQTYFYPSRQACISCHTDAAHHVLGVKTRQLNGIMTYPSGVTDNQLRTWNAVGMFSPALREADIPTYNKLVPISDTSFPIETRARSYLDANCAHCHRPGGARGFFDARFDTPLDQQRLVDGPVANALGIAGAHVITPHSLAQSIVHVRVAATDGTKMPPLARNRVDVQGLATLDDWINSLQASLPVAAPWASQDVGYTNVAGSVTATSTGFIVNGSGDDIGGTTDSFQFLSQPISGDGDIVVRVNSVQNTYAWAKAGIMFRETLDATSAYAMAFLTPNNGAFFQSRLGTAENSSSATGNAATPPSWLRLVRSGATITGYVSTDGTAWQSLGTATLSIAATATLQVGLVVTSHDNSTLCAGAFDNVRVTGTAAPSPPGAPTGLVATASSSTQVGLTWTDNASSETGFKIERSLDGTTFAQIATVAANVSSYQDTGLTPSTTYSYRVRASGGAGDSAYSNVAAATTTAAASPPAAPTALNATATSATQVNLAWTDNATTETGFKIERSVDGVSFSSLATVAANAVAYQDTGLTAATQYWYRVRATSSAGDSAYSNIASVTTQATAVQLPAPSSLTATATSASQIDLAWTDNATSETGYKVERSSDAATFTEIAVLGANVTTYSDTGLTAATAYSYRVRAAGSGGDSPYSNVAAATTRAATASWQHTDVGAVGLEGSEDTSTATITVRGSGSDVWDRADAFHFVYRTLAGDGAIEAQVVSLTNTHSWAKAGVMIRESLVADARNVFACVTAANGVSVQARDTAGAATISAGGPWGIAAPYRVRLVRTGNTVVGSASRDGSTWTTIATYTVAMSSTVYVGLAVTSHDNAALCTGTFDHVTITGAGPTAPAAPAAPSGLTAQAIAAGEIDLAWADNSANEDNFVIERSPDGVTFAALTTVQANVTTYSDLSVAASSTYTYRVRATNAAGASGNSNVASATTPAATVALSPPTNVTASATSSTSIDLRWTDNSGSETGFAIERATNGGSFAALTLVGANVTQFADTNLAPSTSYSYRLRATSPSGSSPYSMVATATTAAATNPGGAWSHADIGNVGVAGSDDTTGSPITVRGAGSDVWDNVDSFRFVYQPLNGDGAIQARVVSLTNTYPWAKAGVMIRESLNANAANVFACVTPSNGMAAQVRSTAGAATTSAGGPWGVAAPYYVRLIRTGNTVVASGSTDGTAWTTVATYNVTFGTTVYLGLAVTSHQTTTLCTATFDNVITTGTGTPTPTPPAAPSGLTATAFDAGRIDLVWTDNSTNEDGFQIERASDGIAFSAIATAAANVSRYSDAGLAASSTYTYRVRATSTAGNSGYSNTAAATTAAAPPATLPAPSGLAAAVISQNQINLQWTDNSTTEQGFAIERATASGAFVGIATVGPNVTVYANTGLTAGTTYSYRVRATASGGDSAFSNTATATTSAATTPSTWSHADVGNVGVPGSDDTSTNTITVQGSGNDVWDTSDGFRFVYRTISGDCAIECELTSITNTYPWAKAGVMMRESLAANAANVFVAVTPSNGVAAQIRAVTGGNTTSTGGPWGVAAPYRVRLVRTGNTIVASGSRDGATWTTIATYNLAFSGPVYVGLAVTSHQNNVLCTGTFNQVVVTGGVTSQPPAAPTALRATAVSANEIDLSWTDNSASEDGFRIERSTDGTSFTPLATVGANAVTYVDSGLGGGTTYYYRVRANSSAGDSAVSNVATATTNSSTPTLAAPSNLSATATSSTQINLAWSDNSTNESGFKIERTTAGGAFTEIATVGANVTSYANTSLSPSTAYTYRIRATNSAADSNYSNSASATTPAAPTTTWSHGDVGAVRITGSDDASGNTITVRGSGDDIWDSADSFHFVYRTMTGDCLVEAQVSSLTNTHAWAKAGVMIRDSLAANAANAFVCVTPSSGIAAQFRNAAGANTTSTSGPWGAGTPYWVRLVRTGNTIVASISPDGVAWTTLSTATIPMAATVQVGFAVTSHDNNALNTAVFTDPFIQ